MGGIGRHSHRQPALHSNTTLHQGRSIVFYHSLEIPEIEMGLRRASPTSLQISKLRPPTQVNLAVFLVCFVVQPSVCEACRFLNSSF